VSNTLFWSLEFPRTRERISLKFVGNMALALNKFRHPYYSLMIHDFSRSMTGTAVKVSPFPNTRNCLSK